MDGLQPEIRMQRVKRGRSGIAAIDGVIPAVEREGKIYGAHFMEGVPRGGSFSVFDASASDFKLGHYLFFDICVNGVHFCWRYPLLALST